MLDFLRMKPYQTAFAAIGGVLVLHAILLITGGYYIPQIDVPDQVQNTTHSPLVPLRLRHRFRHARWRRLGISRVYFR